MVDELSVLEEARKAKQNSFTPYSGYKVGSSLLANGSIYQGANIEISGRMTSVHAEMVSCYKAVMDSSYNFELLCVSTDDLTGEGICGLCQHTLSQFVSKDEDLKILEDVGDDNPVEYRLRELIGDGYSASTRYDLDKLK